MRNSGPGESANADDARALPSLVSQCAQGFPMRNQFALRNTIGAPLIPLAATRRGIDQRLVL